MRPRCKSPAKIFSIFRFPAPAALGRTSTEEEFQSQADSRIKLVLQAGDLAQALRQITADPGPVALFFRVLAAPTAIKCLPEKEPLTQGPIQVETAIYLPVLIGLPTHGLGEPIGTFFAELAGVTKPRPDKKRKVIEFHTHTDTGVPTA